MHFLDKVLALVGWGYLTENALRGFNRACKKPDYSLYPSREALAQAAAAPLDTAAVRLALTVLEAKRFNHPLDAVSKRETPHLFPCQQIQEYLRLARDERGQRFFDWAILSNGNESRLYTERSSADAYFSFTLVNPDGSLRSTPKAATALRLNIVDPAMGSGHFLVRAVEWLEWWTIWTLYPPAAIEQSVRKSQSGETSKSR
jgi:hypothetical protein